MSFSETIFLFFLALIIFGPKKLPEMARQAGRLLAELRRASNEFKSQIESEIAHIEVQKAQAELPPTPPPQGTVASLSLNPAATESVAPHQIDPAATLAAPANGSTTTANPSVAPALSAAIAEATPSPMSTPSTDSIAEAADPASQASHV
jgi:sec-independent protein translocase protein TatB